MKEKEKCRYRNLKNVFRCLGSTSFQNPHPFREEEEEEDEFYASFAKTLEAGSESKGERQGCENALKV